MRLLLIVLLCCTYVGGGVFMENHEVITEPAAWAFYGAMFGMFFTGLVEGRKKG